MKTISNRIKYAYIIVLALIMTACHEKKAPEIETTVDTVIKVDEENDEYEYDEVKDTTSAHVAAWLQAVSMDSIERLLCRHDTQGGRCTCGDPRRDRAGRRGV